MIARFAPLWLAGMCGVELANAADAQGWKVWAYLAAAVAFGAVAWARSR